MIAEIQANRAKVVLAEANVPKAIAEAIRSGKMGIMDYYELNNVQADTRMRAAIAARISGPTNGRKFSGDGSPPSI